MSTISVAGKNFWVAVILAFCFGGIGHFYLGQSKKGVALLILSIVMWILGLGWIPAWLGAIDIWLLREKIEAGGEMGMFENGLKFLDGIPGFKEG